MIGEGEALLRSQRSRLNRPVSARSPLRSAHVYRSCTGSPSGHVVQLCDALFALTGSPVVALNRALAIAEVHGVRAALDAMPDPAADARLAEYQPYWASRAEQLTKTGAHAEACHAYEIAIGLDRDPAVRRFLQQRKAALAP